MDRSPDQDRDDVARVLAGDVEAFSGIVHRWQGPLVTLAFRFCRHPSRAEELAQEAFLRAYPRLGQWRGDAAFSTWLFAVATNVYRSEVRRVRPEEVALQETDGTPGDGDVLASIEAGEQVEIVRRTVGTLPRRYRDAVVLYYFSDMDGARAARSLGVPTGTLKARLHRARSLLRDRLSRMMDRNSRKG